MDMVEKENEKAKCGKLSGAIYGSESDVTKDCEQAMRMFSTEWSLSPELFPSV